MRVVSLLSPPLQHRASIIIKREIIIKEGCISPQPSTSAQSMRLLVTRGTLTFSYFISYLCYSAKWTFIPNKL